MINTSNNINNSPNLFLNRNNTTTSTSEIVENKPNSYLSDIQNTLLKKEHDSSKVKPLYTRDISRTPVGRLFCPLRLLQIRNTWNDDEDLFSMVTDWNNDDENIPVVQITDVYCGDMYDWDRGFSSDDEDVFSIVTDWNNDDENIPVIQITDVSYERMYDWDRRFSSDDEDIFSIVTDWNNDDENIPVIQITDVYCGDMYDWDRGFSSDDETVESNSTNFSPTSSQTLDVISSIKPKTLDPLAILKEEYYALGRETDFIIPERRVCNFNYANDSLYNIGRAQKAIFITNDEIISLEPMKFLPHSPFIKPVNEEEQTYIDSIIDVAELREAIDSRKKAAQAIAITRSGKHVILQQAVRSCVPTCVAMLGLDHGKTPNYELIVEVSLANHEQQSVWLKELGFEVYPLKLQLIGEHLTTWPKIIFKHLAEFGPGILTVTHPEIGNHAVILDAISPDLQTATIRDPFHGRMVTIKIALLQSWINSLPAEVRDLELMQVKSPS